MHDAFVVAAEKPAGEGWEASDNQTAQHHDLHQQPYPEKPRGFPFECAADNGKDKERQGVGNDGAANGYAYTHAPRQTIAENDGVGNEGVGGIHGGHEHGGCDAVAQ